MTPSAVREVSGFAAYGVSHLAVLALTALVPVILVASTRGAERSGLREGIARGLALGLAGSGVWSWMASGGAGGWTRALPMHFCDWALVATAVALVWRGRWWSDVAYFWGLGGTLQAVFTPDLPVDFPHPRFIEFFLVHCGIVVGVMYLVFGLGMRPVRGSVWRAFGMANVYLACAAVVNVTCGTNFGYLRAKPAQASLMDVLGPWPWYIGSLVALALVLFGLLYAPWWWADRSRRVEASRG